MLSQQDNERLTQTGPGTPCGDVLRRYWQPAALCAELEGERPVLPVTLLGERLVLFRDEKGRLGLMDRQCPHRGVDLCYGRLENGGLRCPFHGWLFDHTGQCLEMPGEPADSRMFENIRARSYPCVEKGGIVFAFMGDGEPPPLPNLDCLAAPDSHTFAFKGFMECNWLQALEVGIDPVHASFLHRFLSDGDADDAYGLQFRGNTVEGDAPVTSILRDYARPDIHLEPTDFGLRIVTTRDLEGDARHVRVTNLAFPQAIVIPMSADMNITQWHVPVDDETSYWYAMFTAFDTPVDHEKMRQQRETLYEIPGYRPRINKSNNYGFDPAEQRTKTYTGMGEDINVHDQWAVESPGPVADRTKEHLATSDKAIIANRRLLRVAMEAADKVPGAVSDERPVAIDTVGTKDNWTTIWRERDEVRRCHSPWARET